MLPIPGPPVPPGPQADLCQGPPLCRHRQSNRSSRLRFNMHKSPNSIPADSDPPKVFQHTGFSRGVMNTEETTAKSSFPLVQRTQNLWVFSGKPRVGYAPAWKQVFALYLNILISLTLYYTDRAGLQGEAGDRVGRHCYNQAEGCCTLIWLQAENNMQTSVWHRLTFDSHNAGLSSSVAVFWQTDPLLADKNIISSISTVPPSMGINLILPFFYPFACGCQFSSISVFCGESQRS